MANEKNGRAHCIKLDPRDPRMANKICSAWHHAACGNPTHCKAIKDHDDYAGGDNNEN